MKLRLVYRNLERPYAGDLLVVSVVVWRSRHVSTAVFWAARVRCCRGNGGLVVVADGIVLVVLGVVCVLGPVGLFLLVHGAVVLPGGALLVESYAERASQPCLTNPGRLAFRPGL